jgi:hypothetical protein
MRGGGLRENKGKAGSLGGGGRGGEKQIKAIKSKNLPGRKCSEKSTKKKTMMLIK